MKSVPVSLSARDLPESIDAHPLVVRHAEQRRQLADALTAVRSERAILVGQRQDLFDRQVQELVQAQGKAPVDLGLAKLDHQVAQLAAREQQLEQGLGQLDVDAKAVRAAARDEMAGIITSRVNQVVGRLSAAFDEILSSAEELDRLRRYRLVAFPSFILLALIREHLRAWRREAASFQAS